MPCCAGIGTASAQAADGVVAVLTGDDYQAAGLRGIDHHPNPAGAVKYEQPTFQNSLTGSVFSRPQLPLAVGKVRHVGEPVALVIAETLAQARDAAELIEIDYEALDAVVQVEDALREGAARPLGRASNNLCFQVEFGEHAAAAAIFADAPHIVERVFRHSRIVNCQMEPRAAIGCYEPASGQYTLISGSQGVVRQKTLLAGALGVAPDAVRVVCPDTGGGFGARTNLYVEQLAVVWAHAWSAGRSSGPGTEAKPFSATIRDAMPSFTPAWRWPMTADPRARLRLDRQCRGPSGVLCADGQRLARHDVGLSCSGRRDRHPRPS
ncbi:MAG: molybdopterin cofactor-binding domain-containing protein [Aliidongia sp.]